MEALEERQSRQTRQKDIKRSHMEANLQTSINTLEVSTEEDKSEERDYCQNLSNERICVLNKREYQKRKQNLTEQMLVKYHSNDKYRKDVLMVNKQRYQNYLKYKQEVKTKSKGS